MKKFNKKIIENNYQAAQSFSILDKIKANISLHDTV